MKSQFVRVESEHSVMAGMVGASMTGARTFTATSGQGLLYMTEMVHWVCWLQVTRCHDDILAGDRTAMEHLG